MAENNQDFLKKALPFLGLAEILATKGRSPGTFALTQQKLISEGEQQRRDIEKEFRANQFRQQQQALQSKIGNLKVRQFEAQEKQTAQEAERKAAFLRKIEQGGLTDQLDTPGKIERVVESATPRKTFELIRKENKEDRALRFKEESAEEKSFTQRSKDYDRERRAWQRLERSAIGTPGGDLAMIFNFMRLNDPTSTVRTDEFETAAGARAALAKQEADGKVVPAFIKQFIDQITRGTRLLPDQRADFINIARAMFRDKLEDQQDVQEFFETRANSRGLQIENIIGNNLRVTDELFQLVDSKASGKDYPTVGGFGQNDKSTQPAPGVPKKPVSREAEDAFKKLGL